MAVAPMLNKGVEALGLGDDAIPAYAHSVVDAMLTEAEKKGNVTFLERYTFSVEDMRRLKELLNSNLSV
jgi:PHP family Zn ribbon phosphoesterase